MKLFILLLAIPFFGWTQFEPNKKLYFKTTLVTDTAVVKGYFIKEGDSAIILSTTKKYIPEKMVVVPISSIKEMNMKNRDLNWAGVAVISTLSFLVTAGLTHLHDYNNDGKTSFWELMWSAIEGSTSSNRRRRNTALIAGAAGGTAGFLIAAFSKKKLSLIFPINNRNNFYSEKRASVMKFVDF